MWSLDNSLSEKFYKKLGFEVVESDDSHSTVQLGDFQLVLVSMRDEEEFNNDSLAAERGRGMYIYIKVDDIDTKYAELQKVGVAATTEPRDWDWDNREFIVKDPDGYKLCFWNKSK